MGDVDIAAEQRVAGEGTTLAFVVGVEDDEAVFHGGIGDQGPEDQGGHSDEVVARWGLVSKGGREDVEGRSADVAVDDADALVGQEEQFAATEDLALFVIAGSQQTRVVRIVIGVEASGAFPVQRASSG